MKKKLISGLSALAMLAMPLTAYADQTITELTDPPQGDAEITTNIDPTFTVTIPSDVTVAFGDNDTAFGTVELTQAQLEINAGVKVTVTTDGELNNAADAAQVIPYTLTSEGADIGKVYAQVFTQEGESFDLTIHIEDADWNSAYAGSYSDTVVFDVEYVVSN
ncbi:MAG: hypothetical protein IKN17_01105 [Ruminococcus sp.]|nr:hypothetical protein [Ruminococcus sp.]